MQDDRFATHSVVTVCDENSGWVRNAVRKVNSETSPPQASEATIVSLMSVHESRHRFLSEMMMPSLAWCPTVYSLFDCTFWQHNPTATSGDRGRFVWRCTGSGACKVPNFDSVVHSGRHEAVAVDRIEVLDTKIDHSFSIHNLHWVPRCLKPRCSIPIRPTSC